VLLLLAVGHAVLHLLAQLHDLGVSYIKQWKHRLVRYHHTTYIKQLRYRLSTSARTNPAR
jgi:hypothetical protein